MANPSNIPESKIVGALRKWGGVKALAAKELNTSRQNIQVRVNNSPRLQQEIADIDEENLDIGEGHLVKLLRKGDKDIVKYFLDRKGKKRGYGTKIEANIRLSETDIAALVTAFGGNISAMRAFHARLAGTDPDPNSTGYPPAR